MQFAPVTTEADRAQYSSNVFGSTDAFFNVGDINTDGVVDRFEYQSTVGGADATNFVFSDAQWGILAGEDGALQKGELDALTALADDIDGAFVDDAAGTLAAAGFTPAPAGAGPSARDGIITDDDMAKTLFHLENNGSFVTTALDSVNTEFLAGKRATYETALAAAPADTPLPVENTIPPDEAIDQANDIQTQLVDALRQILTQGIANPGDNANQLPAVAMILFMVMMGGLGQTQSPQA